MGIGTMQRPHLRVFFIVHHGQVDGARHMVLGVFALAARIDDEGVVSGQRTFEQR
jgi:hypothetical protein